MDRIRGAVLLAAACGMFVATAADAKHLITRTVHRNVETRITDDFMPGDDCQALAAPPAAVIVTPPQHGHLQQHVVREVLSAAHLHTDQKFTCEGKRILIRYVTYKSRGPYVGPDSFRLEWTEGGERTEVTYSFDVR